MIHPSYVELMKVVNHDVAIGEEPVVNSRYSIVIAAAKRARQIIGGAEPMLPNSHGKKPLSIAVEELYVGDVKILSVKGGCTKCGCLRFDILFKAYGESNENTVYFIRM